MSRFRIIIVLLCSVSFVEAQLSCERQQTCKKCAPNKYSYYKCRAQSDCYDNEFCTDGFCCTQDTQGTTSSPIDGYGVCPDGSGSVSNTQCYTDSACSFPNANCVTGRCCSTCNSRAQQLLNSLSREYVPQCESDGRYWRNRQCNNAQQCWCVTKYGSEIQGTRPTGANCAEMVRMEEAANPSRCTRLNTRAGTCPRITYLSPAPLHKCTCDTDCFGNQKCCLSANGRECAASSNTIDNTAVVKVGYCPSTSSTSFSTFNQCVYDGDCAGAMKCCPGSYGRQCRRPEQQVTVSPSQQSCALAYEEYTVCRNPCESTCALPNRVPCPSLTCTAGCQCRPGYVRQFDSPNAPCVRSTTCSSSQQCTQAQKTYNQCGSACPPGCDNLTPSYCTTQCVAGCFCDPPYVLEYAGDSNSRCVLRQQCQTTATTVGNTIQRCNGAYKAWNTCGSACPQSCDRQNGICTAQCVSGCFCQAPYILQKADDPNSPCVLQSQCASTTDQQCSSLDVYKTYQTCGSNCPAGCNRRNPTCSATCASGCFCRPPYILSDAFNTNSKCVLPQQCSNDCPEPEKEYLSCGTACPIGCDNLNPTSFCAPCQAGCFCKSGYVFRNATDWRNSQCLRREQCSKEGVCPSSSIDTPGAYCNSDTDCPAERKCCRVPGSISSGSRCLCGDTYAQYLTCGSSCPDFCGRVPNQPCSTACKTGCFCRAGYIRQYNSPFAPCIRPEQCSATAVYGSTSTSSGSKTATVFIRGVGSSAQATGVLTLTPSGTQGMRLQGTIHGLPVGAHGFAIFEYGDISNDCRNIGGHFNPDGRSHGGPSTSNRHAGDLGNLQSPFGPTQVDILIPLISTDGGRYSVLGRAIGVHQSRDDQGVGGSSQSTIDGNAGPAIACGLIGWARP